MDRKTYTVILLYPDYISDNNETYLAVVRSRTPLQAALKAQKEAIEAQCDAYEYGNPLDFKVLYVFEGAVLPAMSGLSFERQYEKHMDTQHGQG